MEYVEEHDDSHLLRLLGECRDAMLQVGYKENAILIKEIDRLVKRRKEEPIR